MLSAGDYATSNESFRAVLDEDYLPGIAGELFSGQCIFTRWQSTPNSQTRPVGPTQVAATSRRAS